MHYEQYYQIAHPQKFIDNVATKPVGDMTPEEFEEYTALKSAMEASLVTCRVLEQQPTVYNHMRCCGVFTAEPGMIIRHLEFSNGNMQSMWANAISSGDFSLLPFKIDEVNAILANEPSQQEG